MKFISITRIDRGNFSTSTLTITDRQPDALGVLGVLPHGGYFKPSSNADRDALVEWLQSRDFEQEG